MKRIVLMLLLSAVILTSCSLFTAKQTGIDLPMPGKDTVKAGETEFRIVGNLPDIGPYSGSLRSRFYQEPTYDFIPSSEYGEIIPYIGSYRVFKTDYEDWNTEMGYASYGFCTPEGKIVMDASDKNTYVNYNETKDGFGYYSVTRNVNQKNDAPDEGMPEETLIIPKDGSWCIKLDSLSHVSSIGGGYISVSIYDTENYKSLGVDIYDYEGNYIRSEKDADSTGEFSFGLMPVTMWDENGTVARYVDKDGITKYGPFKRADSFNRNGVAVVEDEEGAYLMNAFGKKLTTAYENIFTNYSDDYSNVVYTARHMYDNNQVDIFSKKGNCLSTISGTSYISFRFPDDGSIVYYYSVYPLNEKGEPIYSQENMVFRRLGDNSDIVSKEFGVNPNSYDGHNNCYVHHDSMEKKMYLFDAEGETIAFLSDVYELVLVSKNNRYVVYHSGDYDYNYNAETGTSQVNDTRKLYIYDTEKKENIWEAPKAGYAHYGDYRKDDRFVLVVVYNDESESMFGGTTRCWLLDTLSGEILFEDCENIEIKHIGDKTYISVCDDNTSTLYDENLNVILKYYNE